jgi:hypothetical protein
MDWCMAPGETQAPRRGGGPAQSRRLPAAEPQGLAKQVGPTTQGVHIYADDLVELVGQINSKVVIPVHTFEAERFQQRMQNVRRLQDGETWML